MDIRKKIVFVLALILVSVLSMSKVSDWATNPANHSHSISEIDEKIITVMELTAGATATSAAISFLPDVTAEISIKSALNSCARMRESVVFPVPGGP